MKLKSSALGFFFVLAVIATAFIAVTNFANKPFLFAKVTVKIDPELKQAARGKHQLFLVVFDQNSKLPMPYGAYRTEVDNFEQQKEFILSEHNLTVMNPAAPKPQKLRIKARLEQDGQAGPDKLGDLTGESLIDIGSETTVTINKLIK